jgi:S-formylglutathione hydrolase
VIKVLASLAFSFTAFAQTASVGTVEHIKIHGKSLEGNLEGDSPDRDATVYLPPSYTKETSRRYPVVYLLHGYTGDDTRFGLRFLLPGGADKSLANGTSKEMILVMPNAYTIYQGSMFSNSITTGDWEAFIAQDVVSYMDTHYRTLPTRDSRGLAGHSMGGYGTLRIGMKHPEVFSALYLLSPCCMSANLNPSPQTVARIAAFKTPAEGTKADFGTGAMIASAAAWSPNPDKPPFYFDLPIEDGKLRPEIVAKWAANAPLAMVEQYIPSLRQMKGIGMDAGDKDEPIATTVRTLDKMLTSYKIDHAFAIYEGDHNNRIGERVETKVLPFFSQRLAFK